MMRQDAEGVTRLARWSVQSSESLVTVLGIACGSRRERPNAVSHIGAATAVTECVICIMGIWGMFTYEVILLVDMGEGEAKTQVEEEEIKKK